MTMDGSLHRDKSTGRFSPRNMVNPAVSWYNVKDQIKPISRDTWEASSTDLHNQTMDSRKLRDQCENNTKLLGVTDPASSGRSSALRVSRSSQPPSFDSYDSSASAISWASSADPEMNQINTQAIAPFTDISTRGFQSSSNADQGPSEMALSTFTGDTPGIPQLGNSFKNAAKTSSLVNKEEKNNWESKEKSSLKLIGLERDHEENEKLSPSSGGQHIKGLWKRAFQSFRKDKNKRDKSIPDPKTEQNISDEIDPVYHLLRCAASKSQVTGALTSGKRSSNLAHHRDSSPSDVPLATATPVSNQFMARSVSMRNPRTDIH
ncbi:unnamed protein product [Dicrocoelium dendriticum]|nr:unnamed protein product [Dicrocoelium dendriticum]